MAEELPDYQRAFDQPDFRGYFRWTAKLSDALGGSVYHACHKDELKEILDAGEVDLRSEWALRLPKHGEWSAPGVWVGLNYFANGNFYGPLLIKFPISILNGRHFMVFHRQGDRKRYFFVQYEARIPIYSFGRELWRKVNPEYYFDKSGKSVSKKNGAIYDIVLTNALDLDDYAVKAVEHPKCISGKCGGTAYSTNEKVLLGIAKRQAKQMFAESARVQGLLEQFPCLEGQLVKLEHVDD
jgi:hypothetical protein